MLTELAANINAEPLPDVVPQDGIAYPRRDALLVHSAQYQVDAQQPPEGIAGFDTNVDETFDAQMVVDVALPP